MPVKIIPENKKHDFFASGLTKGEIIAMVNKYCESHIEDPKLLKFSHFTLSEIFDLLLSNFKHILNGSDTLDDLKNILNIHGIRVYIGEHCKETCPIGKDYEGYDTTILVCTKKGEDGVWEDLLDVKDSVSGSLRGMEGGGLDKTAICQPDCGESMSRSIIFN